MSSNHLEPRAVASRPFKRWSKDTFEIVVHAPLPLLCACVALLAIDGLAGYLISRAPAGFAGEVVRDTLDTFAYLIPAALSLYMIAVARAVDRQESLFAHLRSLAGNRIPVVRCFAVFFLLGLGLNTLHLVVVFFLGLLMGVSAPPPSAGGIEYFGGYAHTMLTAVVISIAGIGPFFGMLMLAGGVPDIVVAKSLNERVAQVHGVESIRMSMLLIVPAVIVGTLVAVVDEFLPMPVVSCVSICVVLLFAYVAYRDIFEHQDGNRERAGSRAPAHQSSS